MKCEVYWKLADCSLKSGESLARFDTSVAGDISGTLELVASAQSGEISADEFSFSERDRFATHFFPRDAHWVFFSVTG